MDFAPQIPNRPNCRFRGVYHHLVHSIVISKERHIGGGIRGVIEPPFGFETLETNYYDLIFVV
jgi:hypothetical protein